MSGVREMQSFGELSASPNFNLITQARNKLTSRQKTNTLIKVLIGLALFVTIVLAISKFKAYQHVWSLPCLTKQDVRRKALKPVDVPIITGSLSWRGFGYNRDESYQTPHKPNAQHRETPITFHYPTLGSPVIQTYFNLSKVAESQLASFDGQVLDAIKPYKDTNCVLSRFGSDHDGGYVMCSNWLHQSQGFVNIGADKKDELGCDISTKYLVLNYQYSCSHSSFEECRTNAGNSIHAKGICAHQVSEDNRGAKFYNLEDILKQRGLHGKHTTLRLNEFETKVLKYFPTVKMEHIDQLIINLHFETGNDVWGQLDIVKSIAGEMVPVNVHSNNGACFKGSEAEKRKIPSKSMEVTFVNKRLIKLNSELRSFEEVSLNSANFPTKDFPSCPVLV